MESSAPAGTPSLSAFVDFSFHKMLFQARPLAGAKRNDE